MLFKSVTLAAIASAVVADRTFTLHAEGGDVNGPVTGGSGNFELSVDDGSTLTFDLTEPDGYLYVDGKVARLDPKTGFTLVDDKSEASAPWGLDGNKLRLNVQSQWYACSHDGTGYKIDYFDSGDCTQVDLVVGDAAPSSSSSSAEPSSTEPSSSVEPTSSAPAESTPAESSSAPVETSSAPVEPSVSGNTTSVTQTSETLVTVTSCASSVTDCPARTTHPVSTYEGAAAKAFSGAGALMVAAAALLA